MAMRGRLAVAAALALVGFVIGLSVLPPGTEQTRRVRAPAHPGRQTASALWVLAVGVSRYSVPALNLRYADADARAVADALDSDRQLELYRDVRVMVLTDEEVTRERILAGMHGFLGQAAAGDVVAIFIAGHGVRDRQSGGYYFLPSPAGGTNLDTAALHMSTFADAVHALRHRVRTVVVMLDTCHAGALDISGRPWERMDEPAGGLAPSEDLFILAATKPGEESREDPALGHGAFSYALLQGIAGAADADGDGLVTLGELFAYVAREVPRLTGDTQHPYYRVEGSDVAFVATDPAGTGAGSPPTGFVPPPIVLEPTRDSRGSIGVAVFEDLRTDPRHAWVGHALRLAFNTELSKLDALRVFAPELIDRMARERGIDTLGAAQELAIERLITGSYSVVDDRIHIDARIIDVVGGTQEGSDSVAGPVEDLFELQKRLVLRLLQRLRVRVSPAEGAAIADAEHVDIDAYRLLLESEEAIEEPPAATRVPSPPERSSFLPAPFSFQEKGVWGMSLLSKAEANLGVVYNRLLSLLTPIANAAEPDAVDTEAVREVLAEYRAALEQKDIERLAAVYVSFSDRRRQAQQEYFDNAIDLAIGIADVTVQPHADGLVVSYTRRDSFTDRKSNRAVRLEVRLTRVFVRQGDTWKIGGKP